MGHTVHMGVRKIVHIDMHAFMRPSNSAMIRGCVASLSLSPGGANAPLYAPLQWILTKMDEVRISRGAASVPAEKAVQNGSNGHHNPDGTVKVGIVCSAKSIGQRAGPSES